MTIEILVDENGFAFPIEEIPGDVRRSMERRGVTLTEGYIPAGDGENLARVAVSVDMKAQGDRILSAARRFQEAKARADLRDLGRYAMRGTVLDPDAWANLVLYGDGSGRPSGILKQATPWPWTPPRRRPATDTAGARTYRRDLGRSTALTSKTVIPQG